MRLLLLSMAFLLGCSSSGETSPLEPTGEELFDLILKSANIDLKNEPLCDLQSFTRNKDSITLGEHLSTVLSASYKTDNELKIKSSCSASKHEMSNTEVVDVWDCKIEIEETNKSGEFVSSAMIAFASDLEKSEIIAGSIRCF